MEMRVSIAERANNNHPIAVDLVLVTDKNLFKELQKLSARDWFDKRQQIRQDFPNEPGLSAGSWEWVPGPGGYTITLDLKEDFNEGLVFANYLTPGDHRARIDPRENFQVLLREERFEVTPLKK